MSKFPCHPSWLQFLQVYEVLSSPKNIFTFLFSIDYRFFIAQTNSICFLILVENLECYYLQNNQNGSFRTEVGSLRIARLSREYQLKFVLKE